MKQFSNKFGEWKKKDLRYIILGTNISLRLFARKVSFICWDWSFYKSQKTSHITLFFCREMQKYWISSFAEILLFYLLLSCFLKYVLCFRNKLNSSNLSDNVFNDTSICFSYKDSYDFMCCNSLYLYFHINVLFLTYFSS